MKFIQLVLAILIACLFSTAALSQDNFAIYRVESGDTLDTIAKHLGTDTKTLTRINHLKDPRDLSIGQMLITPKTSGSAPVPAAKPTPASVHPTQPSSPSTSIKTSKPAQTVSTKQKGSDLQFLHDYHDPKEKDSDGSLFGAIIRVFACLVICLAVGVFCIRALRPFLMGQNASLLGKKGHLRVVESITLGPNRTIHLVKIGDRTILLGSTQEQISTLTEIDDPELLSQLSSESNSTNFASHLNGAMNTDKDPDLAGQVQSSIRHLWDRVQDIRDLGSKKGGTRR